MKVRLLGLLSAMLGLVLGCGSGSLYTANVEGKVVYKGAPVTGGTLKFVSADNGEILAGINPDGTYKVTNIVPATYTVYVDNELLNPKKKQPDYNPGSITKAAGGGAKGGGGGPMVGPTPGKGGGGLPGGGGTTIGATPKGVGAAAPPGVTPGQEGVFVEIPAKYHTTGKSDVTITVEKGNNTIDIQLKD